MRPDKCFRHAIDGGWIPCGEFRPHHQPRPNRYAQRRQRELRATIAARVIAAFRSASVGYRSV